jgi:hypothetical protein
MLNDSIETPEGELCLRHNIFETTDLNAFSDIPFIVYQSWHKLFYK